MDATLTIRIPDDVKKELEDLSRTLGLSKSDIVRESLKEYIGINRFRELRRTIKPYAEKKGILTDEDVFKLMS